MDEKKLRGLEKQHKLRVKTGCETCRYVHHRELSRHQSLIIFENSHANGAKELEK